MKTYPNPLGIGLTQKSKAYPYWGLKPYWVRLM